MDVAWKAAQHGRLSQFVLRHSVEKMMIEHWILEVPNFPSTPDVAFEWRETFQFGAC